MVINFLPVISVGTGPELVGTVIFIVIVTVIVAVIVMVNVIVIVIIVIVCTLYVLRLFC